MADGDAIPGWTTDDAVAVLTRIREGVIVVDTDDRILFANEIVAEKVGSTTADVVGKTLWLAVPGLGTSELAAAIRRAQRERVDVIAEGYLGTVGVWLRVNAFPQSDRLVLFVSEITATAQLELAHELNARLNALPRHATFDEDLHALVACIRRTIGYAVGEAWLTPRVGEPMRLGAVDHDDDPDWHRFAERSSGIVLMKPNWDDSEMDERGISTVADLRAHPAFIGFHGADGLGLRSLFRIPADLGGGVHLELSFLSTRPLDADMWKEVVAGEADLIRTWLEGRWAHHELATFFSVSQELLWIIDDETVLRRVNPRLLSAFGYTERDVVGHRFTEFVHPDELDVVAAAFAAFVGDTGETEAFEIGLRDADGSYRLTSWRARSSPNERVVYAAGRDITEERRAARQRELRNDVLVSIASSRPLEETLDTLTRAIEEQADGARSSIMVYDAEGHRLRVAAAPNLPDRFVSAIDGLRVGADAGTCGSAVHHRAPVGAVDLADDPLWAPWRDVALDAGLRACWSVPVLDSAGEPLGSIATYRTQPGAPPQSDVDVLTDAVQLASIAMERDRTERRLAANEERLRLLASVTTDLVFDWDLVESTIWLNDAAGVFAVPTGSMPAGISTFRSRMHPDDQERAVAELLTAIDEADEFEIDFRFRRAGGDGYAETTATGTILRDPDGVGVRVVGGISDVSVQRQLERQALRSQRMESIGNLASGIAHDLNNTLAPIVMAIDLIRTHPLDDEVRASIDLIDASVRRGAAMVRQVLSFARGQDGDRTDVNPARLVRDVERIARDSFPKNIAIHVSVAPDLPSITGDPTQLHQVLLNLLVNARDAMPAGGDVTITASCDTVLAPTSRVPGTSSGDWVVFEVADTGVGIAAIDRERIFEPFFSTKSPTVGTGLGLSTSLAIVRSHGGTIDVESEHGRGATFTIRLPVAGSTPTVTRPRASTSPTHGDGEHVLLVDDERLLRDVTADVLRVSGYHVATAANGADALDVLSSMERVDVVVTDLAMPVMDGNELVAQLRLRQPDVPVIVVSGLVDVAEAADLTVAGVHTVLSKPLEASTLLGALRAALAVSRAPD